MPPAIHRVTQLDLKCGAWTWPFAAERHADIDAHFARQQAEKPQLWNGRVLLGRNPVFSGDRFSADYFETDFASFLAWRDWGFPDNSVFNGFGMGALRGSDGVFVLGEMAAHTANGGRIYFPSGTPDLDDLRDGMVDIPGSVAREVEEETGLTAADYRADRSLGLRRLGCDDCLHPHSQCGYAGRGVAREDRSQSRHAPVAGTCRDPSGARACGFHAGDAAFCHGVHRGAAEGRRVQVSALTAPAGTRPLMIAST